MARHRASLTAAIAEPEPQNRPDIADVAAEMHRGPVTPDQRKDRTAVRTRQRWAEVHALLAQGTTIRAISRELGLARGTARRFARAESADELLVNDRTGYRISVLEAHKSHLHQRWNEGCTNATQLFEEIKALGYQGSERMVRNYLHPFRALALIPAPPRKPPAVRKVVGWIMTNPAALAPEHQESLDRVLAISPELAALTGHVRAFAEIMGERRGRDLEQWMVAVDSDDQPALHSFVRGLRRDQDAVTAGLTMAWSSGTVEGHVNRIKMLKRTLSARFSKFSTVRAGRTVANMSATRGWVAVTGRRSA